MIFEIATILLYCIGAYGQSSFFLPYLDEMAAEEGGYIPLYYKALIITAWPLNNVWYLGHELLGTNQDDE